MKQIIENLELIQLQINKVVEQKGIFGLENPFLKALLDTTIEDLKSQYGKSQRPFDKLKQLWDEWNIWINNNPDSECTSFEEWYMAGTGNMPNVYKVLAERCGFITATEVKKALLHLRA